MKKRLTKKASWFKGNNFTAEDELYVGIDVHKEQYHVAIWHSGRIGCIYSMSSDGGSESAYLPRERLPMAIIR